MNKISIFRGIVKVVYAPYRKISLSAMANSRYEYVKGFELDDRILPNIWVVVRIDGKGFHKFAKAHDFEKPNDVNGKQCNNFREDIFIICVSISALNLMNHAAVTVMEEFRDIVLSYGQSDEYSFIFRREADVYKRRAAKILSYVTSLFTSSYVYNWNVWFPNKKLEYAPSFDGRIVLYPTDQNLRDYLSWRQADVHINNLYNTVFWNLVLKGGMTNQQAENELRGTFSADKNEILFSKFGINYNTIDPMFRKGTILLRKRIQIPNLPNVKRQLIIPLYEDMIRDKFWKEHAEILGKYLPGDHEYEKNEDNDSNKLPELVIRQLEKLNYRTDSNKSVQVAK